MRLHIQLAVFASGLIGLLTACGGGSSSTSALPQTSQAPNSTGRIPFSESVPMVALPSAGGFSSTITFAGLTGEGEITANASITASSGGPMSPAALRRAQSGTIDILYVSTIVPRSTLHLLAVPSLKLSLPAAFASAGKQYYCAISQPPAGGATQGFRTEGPGSLSGRSVEFDATLTPLTLEAGTAYTFVFYALSDTNVRPSQLLYVANAGTNSITEYALPAQGNAAPLRTLAGSRTGLRNPLGLAVDADGNLLVVNAHSDGTAVIEIFKEGANGNAIPLRSFSTPGADTTPPNSTFGAYSNKIALDPFNASIAVALTTDLSRVSTFTPAGRLVRSLSSDDFQTGDGYPPGVLVPAASWVGLNIDAHDRLLAGSWSYDARISQGPSGTVDVFAPNATGSQTGIYLVWFSPFSSPVLTYPAASTYLRSTDSIVGYFRSSFIDPYIVELTNGPDATVVRQFTWKKDINASAIATDSSGDVFVSDASANTIFLFSPLGAAGLAASGAIAGAATGIANVTSMAVGSP